MGFSKRSGHALVASLAAGLLWLSVGAAAAAPFTPGNLVVYRVGDGAATLATSGNAVFLDEYTTAGTLVQSIALPTAASGPQKALVASGTAASDGYLTRSVDGNCLVLPGYGRDLIGASGSLTGTTSAVVPRVVGRVMATGVVDTSTALSDASSAGNFRGAASSDCNSFWVTGAAGVRYAASLGATTSTDVSNTLPAATRTVAVFGGQLYIVSNSTGSKGVSAIGTGAPTVVGQPVTRLPGLSDSLTPSNYSFFFADLSPGVAGVDTLYVADDTLGISKFSFDGTTWSFKGTVGAVTDLYKGLTGVVNGGTVTLYAIRKTVATAAGGGEMVSIADTSGYNNTLTAAPSAALATAGTNKSFRGIALAPEVTVTSTGGTNGTITPLGVQSAAAGSTRAFTVTPDIGFTAVVGGTCGGTLVGTAYTTVPLTVNCTVVASFTAVPTYSVTPSVTGSGTISPTTAVTVLSGATTSFTVTASPGFSASVGGTCGGSLVGDTYTTSVITGNCTVDATFTQITYTITPSAGANGTISPSTPQTVNASSAQVFTVTPDAGYSASVGGTCGGALVGTTYTTNAVSANCTVDATFVALPSFTVTPVVTGSGTVSPAAAQTVLQNATVVFTPTPAVGYSVVMSGCGGKMSGSTFTTAPVTADCTVTASFSQKNILFVGNSYTFARVEPAMSFNAANVNDLTAAFNATYPNGANSWPWSGPTCTGVALQDGCFEPHPWGGVPGIFKALTVQAGLDYNVSLSTRNAATLRGHFLNTSNAVWDLRGNIASQKWDLVMVQGQSDEPLPANKSKNGNPASFKTYASQIAKYVHQGNGQATDLVTTEQAIYAAEGFGTSSNTTPRTIPPNFNANANAKVYVMQNWARPDMVEAHKCTVADYTSNDGAPLVDPTCAAGSNGSNGDNNVYYTAQPTTALNLNDITNDMNSSLSSLVTGNSQFSGVIPTGNAFQKAVDAGVVKNSAFYNGGGTYDESGLINLWWLDRTHGSKYGSYLSALVHFARLSGQDPTQFGGGDAVATGLAISPVDAVTLQQMAKAAVVPGAPTAAAATAASGQVTVSFTAPENLGGLDITGYTVTCGSQSMSGTTSPIVVAGLTNGAPVSCTVVATNSVGNSLPSAASSSVTPRATTTTALGSNLNPTVAGQTVVFTATVSGSGPLVTGTVDFLDGASTHCAAVPLSGSEAQCITATLPAGTRSMTAVYSGDGYYFGSTSVVLTQMVNASGGNLLTVAKAGSGSGTVTGSPPGINCGADCTETYASPTPVSLTATPNVGSIFAGWSGACVGRASCDLTVASNELVVATFAPAGTALNLDVDSSAAYLGESDGLIIARYLFGVRGAALVVDTFAASTNPALIAQRLDDVRPILDVDGDGRTDALTDGVLIVRYLLGLRGDALINSAVSPSARRTSYLDIEDYLLGVTPGLP